MVIACSYFQTIFQNQENTKYKLTSNQVKVSGIVKVHKSPKRVRKNSNFKAMLKDFLDSAIDIYSITIL
jgi:hypothetical protein